MVRKASKASKAIKKNKSVKRKLDQLICSICLEELVNPVRICDNEHYNCASCINKMLNVAALEYSFTSVGIPMVDWRSPVIECPSCRLVVSMADIIAYRSRLIYTLLPNGAQPKKCDHCPLVLCCENRAKHALLCNGQPVICTYCQETHAIGEINDHLAKCSAVPCPYCGETVGSINLHQHCSDTHHSPTVTTGVQSSLKNGIMCLTQ